MVSRIFKGAATLVATLSIAGAASASCSTGMYCGDASAQPISSWTGQTGASHSTQEVSDRYTPSQSYSGQSYSGMSSYQADSTYGTGSISQTYSDSSTYGFSGSTASVPGLGYNESLQSTNCPVNVYGSGEGTVLGCYNVVKPVPQTTYYRVVRPVIYVRYPVPVAVPYASPCHTYKISSRYGDLPGMRRARGGCR
jgi:hypothetical protein